MSCVTDVLALFAPGLALLTAAFLALPLPEVAGRAVNLGMGFICGAAGLAVAAAGLMASQGSPGWVQLDAIGSPFLAVNAGIGMLSAIVSDGYLRGAASQRRWYRSAFFTFWAALLALPVVSNLGMAWILVEATTGASALLVAHSGRRRAVEAGWKYLVLTTLGLTAALLGIVVLYAAGPEGGGLSALDWRALRTEMPAMSSDAVALALVLVVGGLATKVGWAPVHQWLPDAHSEAPAPVSALLSAALLPTVILVVWRLRDAAAAVHGRHTVDVLLLAFGLMSLAFAVPFLWRPLPVKRLLAYSSLEHMGVIALGIGFDQPLAVAGAVLHVSGHAAAKSLGFYSTVALFRVQASAAWRPATGVARRERRLAAVLATSLLALSGLPPSPLFVSELLVLYGGVADDRYLVVGAAAVLLALGFIGLIQQTIEITYGLARPPATVQEVAA